MDYDKIMVPLDGSDLAECVLPHVELIASGCHSTLLELVRVVEPFNLPTRGHMALTDSDLSRIHEDARAEANHYLAAVKARLEGKGFRVTTTVLEGHTTDKLADYVRDSSANLIVISTHGRSGPSRWVWGSVADRLLRSVCVPVLMVRAPGCAAPGA